MHENDFRPTARGLAQYMKELFEQEIAAEEGALRETTQIRLVDESQLKIDTLSLKEAPEKTDVISPKELSGEAKRRRLWYRAVAVIALLVISALIAFLFNKGSNSTPDKIASVSPTKPSAPKPTDRSSIRKASEPSSAQSPSGVSTTLKAGMRALKEERFAHAVALFEKVLAQDPSLKKKISSPYAQALVGYALTLAKKAPHDAESLLLKAAKQDPKSVQAHFQLGLLYMRLENYSKAIKAYKKVAKLDPRFPETFFNLAYIYAVKKDYAKAEKMYGRVVDLAPPYLDEALFNLAMVLERQGKRAESIENLERALKVNPNNKMAKKFLLKLKGDSGEG